VSRGPNVTRDTFAIYAAQRLATHEACADGNTRGGIRAKLRDLAKRLSLPAPTWCLARPRAGDEKARQTRGGGKSRRPKARKPCVMGLAVVPAGAMASRTRAARSRA
jgi:hypothetical protein